MQEYVKDRHKRRHRMSKPTVKKVWNDTGIPLEEIENLPVLFTVKNMWRQRDVVVHKHPFENGKLITVGYWFDGSNVNAVVEDEEDYARELEELSWRTHFVVE